MSLHYSMLASVTLFQGLDLHELTGLLERVEVREFEDNQMLFEVGEPGGALMIVVSGAVEIFVYGDNKSPIVLNTIKVGGFFGEVSLFDNSERSTNAIARGKTSVAVLSRAVVVEYLQKHPDAAINIITVLSKRLRDATSLLVRREANAYAVLHEKLKHAGPSSPLPVEK